jgi:hypothetical protein
MATSEASGDAYVIHSPQPAARIARLSMITISHHTPDPSNRLSWDSHDREGSHTVSGGRSFTIMKG